MDKRIRNSSLSEKKAAHTARCLVTSVLVLGVTGPVVAQDLQFGGQVRPRFEYRDPKGTGRDAFTSMRVRGHLIAALDHVVSVFIQFQDVRTFGEESSTLNDFQADNLDLHQGYIEVRSSGMTTLSARLGRQEIALGAERLIGAVNWAQQGRAFDGLRLAADGHTGRLDVFGAQLGDASAHEISDEAYLLGAYGELLRIGPGTLDVYGFFNRAEGGLQTRQGTMGARWFGQSGWLTFRGEGSYQTGERTGADVSAYMFGAAVGALVGGGAGSVTLWYDFLSGDDDPTDGTKRVFDTLFATNHKFYGLADLFTNIPVHTAGRGLQDLAVKGTYAPHERVALAFDLHSFRVAARDGLTTGHLADEADLTVGYRYTKNFGVLGGFSRVWVADGFEQIGRLGEDVTWLYVMVDLAF